jgi:hypothetical protein
MAYGNNKAFNNGGYNNGQSYGPQQAYGPQYPARRSNGHSNNGQHAQKKHSGAKFKSSDKNGNPCTTGWNKSRFAGFVTFLCVVTSKSVKSESDRGNKYISVMVKVRKQMSPEETTNGLMNTATGQVTIQSMGVVINPKAPNGGYCGRYGKK